MTQKKAFLSLFKSHLHAHVQTKSLVMLIFCVKRNYWYILVFVKQYKFFTCELLKMCLCLLFSSGVLACFACPNFKYLLKILLFFLDLSMVGQTSQKFILVMTHFSSQREHFGESISYVMQSKKEQKRYKTI